MSLADALLTALKFHVASLELVPGKGGCFEVTVDGDKVWSKLESGSFPDEAAVLRKVSSKRR